MPAALRRTRPSTSKAGKVSHPPSDSKRVSKVQRRKHAPPLPPQTVEALRPSIRSDAPSPSSPQPDDTTNRACATLESTFDLPAYLAQDLEPWPSTLPPALSSLAEQYTFLQMELKAGNKIEQRVSALLRQLGDIETTNAEHKQSKNAPQPEKRRAIAVLTADASAANKLLSVLHIAVRATVARGLKVWQYSRLTLLKHEEKKGERGAESSESDDAFETADGAAPFKPVLVVYLSLVAVSELKDRFGEQIYVGASESNGTKE